jgi:hypothetical protein
MPDSKRAGNAIALVIALTTHGSCAMFGGTGGSSDCSKSVVLGTWSDSSESVVFGSDCSISISLCQQTGTVPSLSSSYAVSGSSLSMQCGNSTQHNSTKQ